MKGAKFYESLQASSQKRLVTVFRTRIGTKDGTNWFKYQFQKEAVYGDRDLLQPFLNKNIQVLHVRNNWIKQRNFK